MLPFQRVYGGSEKKKLEAEWCSPHQISMLNFQSLVPQNVITLGDNVFKELS